MMLVFNKQIQPERNKAVKGGLSRLYTLYQRSDNGIFAARQKHAWKDDRWQSA
jgi:hypothetical protein